MLLQATGVQLLALAHHQQGERALAPLRIGHPDHRHFAYRRMAADQVFQLQGGQPLAAGLDHVLDAVADLDEAHAVQGRHVAGVHPAAAPQLLAALGFAEIPLGQPWRAQHQLALGLAVGREEAALFVHDRRIHQRHRHAGLDPVGGALVLASGQQFVVEVGAGNQRTGLRHAVGGGQLDAARLGRLVERAVQRAPADDHLPALEVHALGSPGVHHHLQDGRHAVGEGDLLALPQFDQQFRIVTPGIDLLDPEHGRHVRSAPGVDMEHRGDRHVHVAGTEQADAVQAADGRSHRQGVQDQLPVAEIHTFRIAGGAGGVEGGGDGVLVEIGEVVARAGRGQQRLVFADQAGQFGALLRAVGEQDGPLHRGQLPRHRLVERDELAVHQHEAILGVVHGVEDLFRGEADVDGMQHRPDHRDGEHAFQVAMAVPVHHRHRVAGLHPGLAEYVGQARDALVEGGVAVAHLVAVDDFMTLFVTTAGKHQALDQQRILISAGGGRDETGLQHGAYTWERVRCQDEADSRAVGGLCSSVKRVICPVTFRSLPVTR
ncbi:Uncharacterised protein [Acinetobacter baumannii]|nr:Uncharacterised protein [Acinetobacter baumannii]